VKFIMNIMPLGACQFDDDDDDDDDDDANF
jgi:hypothetical protein